MYDCEAPACQNLPTTTKIPYENILNLIENIFCAVASIVCAM